MLKIIASNTLAQLTAKFIGAGLTFVTTVFIIRLVGPADYGDLTKALVLVAIGFTIIDFGLNALGVRRFATSTSPSLVLADIMSARLLLSFITVVALNILVFVLPGGYSHAVQSVFWLGSLAIFFQGIATSMNAYFQYTENYWLTAWATITGALAVASLTYYFTLESPTLAHFLLAYTAGYATSALASIMFGKQVVSFAFSLRRTAVLLQGSLTLGAILLASIVASKLDTVILGVFRPSAEVGEYGFAYRIFDVLLVLPVFVMNAVYPQLVKTGLARARTLIQQSLVALVAIGLTISCVTYLAAPWILWIRPGLDTSVATLRLLAFALPVFFATAPLMWQLVSARREKVVLKIYVLAALINGLLNLWFIPRYGAPAAALNTGITELFILASLLYHSHYETTT